MIKRVYKCKEIGSLAYVVRHNLFSSQLFFPRPGIHNRNCLSRNIEYRCSNSSSCGSGIRFDNKITDCNIFFIRRVQITDIGCWPHSVYRLILTDSPFILHPCNMIHEVIPDTGIEIRSTTAILYGIVGFLGLRGAGIETTQRTIPAAVYSGVIFSGQSISSIAVKLWMVSAVICGLPVKRKRDTVCGSDLLMWLTAIVPGIRRKF